METSLDECHHLCINDSGCCQDCGIVIECLKMDGDYSGYHSKTSFNVDYTEILELNIPEEIKERAFQIATTFGTRSSRSIHHKQELFASVYRAYLECLREGRCEYPLSPKELAKTLGLKQKEVNTVMKSINGVSNKYFPICEGMEPVIVILSPTQFLEKICNFNGLESHYQKINDFATTILRFDSEKYILEQDPEKMALAIIKVYLDMKQIPFPKLGIKNGMSEGILKQKTREIINVVDKFGLKPT